MVTSDSGTPGCCCGYLFLVSFPLVDDSFADESDIDRSLLPIDLDCRLESNDQIDSRHESRGYLFRLSSFGEGRGLKSSTVLHLEGLS